jgi:hypothetical protein
LVRVLAPAGAPATAPPPPLQRAWVHACCALWSQQQQQQQQQQGQEQQQQQEQSSSASASGEGEGAGEGVGGEGAGAGAGAMDENGALPHTLVDVAYGDLRK